MSNREGFFLATKGGYNNESHNHNDAGTFSLYLHTTPIFIDAGVGTYTRQTFSHERYSIWTMQSDYHNVPLVNGFAQAFGPEYKAGNVRFNSSRMEFTADLAAAYPAEAGIKSWTRSCRLLRKEVRIEDTFELINPSLPNQVNFMCWGSVDVSVPGEVRLEVNGEKVKMKYDPAVFTSVVETVKLDDPRLSDVWGEKIYRVSLNAGQVQTTGKYVFIINQDK